MSTTPTPATTPAWRQHLVAVFVTGHIVCVLISARPGPPGGTVTDQELNHPEVKAELESSIGWLHRHVPWRDSPEEMMRDLLGVVQTYNRVTGAAMNRVRPYLEIAGGEQHWHMFGGTPPRFPLVLIVAVKPEKEQEFVVYQDLNWGTKESSAMNFRHRKVHENLHVSESSAMWEAYARNWARRWDEENPERPAQRVRLSFTRLHTPSGEQVRQGDNDRKPEMGLQRYEWKRP